jgi:hypothetical protein
VVSGDHSRKQNEPAKKTLKPAKRASPSKKKMKMPPRRLGSEEGSLSQLERQLLQDPSTE